DLPDARVAALESAAELLAQPNADAVCKAVVGHVVRDFEGEWAAVVRGGVLAATIGESPSVDWLTAFVAGSGGAGAMVSGPDDVAWAPLGDAGALVIGRQGRPFRERERRQLVALARIVAWRLTS